MTLKPAVVDSPKWDCVLSFFLGFPSIFLIVVAVVFVITFIDSLILFFQIIIRAIKFMANKNKYHQTQLFKYLESKYKNDSNKNKKINKWLLIHHLQATEKLFDKKFYITSDIYNRINYDLYEHQFGIGLFNFWGFGFFYTMILFIPLTLFLSNIGTKWIVLILYALGILFLYLFADRVIFNRRPSEPSLKNQLFVKNNYPNAYKYLFFNEVTSFSIPESIIQIIDYQTLKYGLVVNNLEEKLKYNKALRENFNQEEYYKYYIDKNYKKGNLDPYVISDFENQLDSKTELYQKAALFHRTIGIRKKTKHIKRNIATASFLILGFVFVALSMRLYNVNSKLVVKHERIAENKETAIYNKLLSEAKSKPDSVVVEAKSKEIEYGGIGQEWTVHKKFNKNELSDSNCFALKDVEKKNIPINTTIIENDETYSDYSYNTFYIRINKDELIKNDSSLCWTTTQTIHENSKRKNQGYAVWQTEYIVSLKPKTIPKDEIPSQYQEVQSEEIIDKFFFKEPVEIPIIQTKFEHFLKYIDDFIEPFRKVFS